MRIRLIISCLLTLLTVVCSAQSGRSDLRRGENSFFANYIHSVSAFGGRGNTLTGNIWGVSAGYNFSMDNNNSYWARALDAKNVVLAFSYINMKDAAIVGSPQPRGILGEAFNVQGQLDLTLFNINKIRVALLPGFGLSYVTETFRTNDNRLIGSHINMNTGLGMKVEIPFTGSTKIVVGADIFHFSNTAYKLPNNGINFINTSVGVVTGLHTYEKERKRTFNESAKKGAFEFGIGVGHRGLQQQFGVGSISLADSLERKFGTSKLNNVGMLLGYNYRLNPLLSIKTASDIVYYTTTFDRPNYRTTTQEYGTSKDKFSVGLSAGFDIWLNKLVFEASYGYYLHLNYFSTPVNTYWSAGVKYYVKPWVALEAKTHLHKAEAHYTNFGVLFSY